MNRFDGLAATWDDDPAKVAGAERAAASLRDAIPLVGSGWSALELGSGTGLLSRALAADLGAITLVDTSEQMTIIGAERVSAATEEHVTACCLDLTVETPPTAPYEIAYSMLALHHMADVAAVLMAVHEVLVPGGWVGILDLDHDPDGSFHRAGAGEHHPHEHRPQGHERLDHEHLGQHEHADQHGTESVDHVHDGFSPATLTTLLRSAGFVDVEVAMAGFAVEKGEPPRAYPVVRAVGRRAPSDTTTDAVSPTDPG